MSDDDDDVVDDDDDNDQHNVAKDHNIDNHKKYIHLFCICAIFSQFERLIGLTLRDFKFCWEFSLPFYYLSYFGQFLYQ